MTNTNPPEWAGSGRSFEIVVDPLLRPGYELAVAMLTDPEAARDALQEATIHAWKKIGQLRTGASARPWFLAIVANECRAIRRARWWSVIKLPEPQVAETLPTDQILARTDLEAALRRLNPSDRLVLFLRFYLDLPLDEIAHILRVSAPAAKARLYRAIDRLRPIVELGEVLPDG